MLPSGWLIFYLIIKHQNTFSDFPFIHGLLNDANQTVFQYIFFGDKMIYSIPHFPFERTFKEKKW